MSLVGPKRKGSAIVFTRWARRQNGPLYINGVELPAEPFPIVRRRKKPKTLWEPNEPT